VGLQVGECGCFHVAVCGLGAFGAGVTANAMGPAVANWFRGAVCVNAVEVCFDRSQVYR
jgi:hypothetical protein